jgi:hypothetical protein
MLTPSVPLPSNFIVSNTQYNLKPMPGLPVQTLKALQATGYKLSGTGPAFGYGTTGTFVYPASLNTPYAMSDYMTLNQTIKGFEQGFLGRVSGPQ